MAKTKSDGTFALTTYDLDDGAPEGDYLASVMVLPERSDGEMVGTKPTAVAIPGKYGDPRTSGLTCRVAPVQDNRLPTFELTSAPSE
jgi:hypothetical protein